MGLLHLLFFRESAREQKICKVVLRTSHHWLMSLSRLWRVENGGIYDESLHIMLFACLLWEKIFRRNEAKKPNPMGKVSRSEPTQVSRYATSTCHLGYQNNEKDAGSSGYQGRPLVFKLISVVIDGLISSTNFYIETLFEMLINFHCISIFFFKRKCHYISRFFYRFFFEDFILNSVITFMSLFNRIYSSKKKNLI